MQRWPRSLALLAAWSTLALTLTARPGIAQNGNAKADAVRFDTVDGVTIVGRWYKSSKANAPVVMLLHAVGKNEDSQKTGWDDLAKTLQDKGYAVLAFDFRGHGDSTSVAPRFWMNPANGQLVERPKGNLAPEDINYKQFKEQYYPVLVNDIAAAKAFLDRKNDAGECNTSALALIGAETGATLGSIWLNSEWNRYKYYPADPFDMVNPMNRIPRLALEPEGKGTIAAVWLSPTPGFARRTVSLAQTLAVPVKLRATPMTIIFSDDDLNAKKTATGCLTSLNLPKEAKYKYTGPLPVKGAEKLSGRGLLQPSLELDKAITEYLYKVVDKKTPEWVDRETRTSQYAWGTPQPPGRLPILRFGNTPLLAPLSIQEKNGKTMPWNSYDSFAPR